MNMNEYEWIWMNMNEYEWTWIIHQSKSNDIYSFYFSKSTYLSSEWLKECIQTKVLN
jgi:hypothetical protein